MTIDQSKITRREVRHFKNAKHPELGYIHINGTQAGYGLEKFLRKTKWRRIPYLDYHISGDQKSLAYKIVKFINDKYMTYPYIHDYNFFVGPNCNTFIQWIFNHFPSFKFTLPRVAFGKNHK